MPLFDILTLSVCEFVILYIVNVVYYECFIFLCCFVNVDWLLSIEWGVDRGHGAVGLDIWIGEVDMQR